MELAMMASSLETRLRRWRRMLLVRDCKRISVGKHWHRRGYCLLCNNTFETWRLQAHHIKPKSIYPELALQLNNGIMLCQNCHIGLVHSGNSFVDLNSENHWKVFQPVFTAYNRNFNVFVFNRNNQDKI